MPEQRPRPVSPPEPLPLRWAVILMGALVAGVLVGVLILAQTGMWPAALLAALTTAGMAVPALHAMLGR